jgi:hypothetical protein
MPDAIPPAFQNFSLLPKLLDLRLTFSAGF